MNSIPIPGAAPTGAFQPLAPAHPPPPTSSRSRQQARKRAAPAAAVGGDAGMAGSGIGTTYRLEPVPIASAGAGTKRPAGADGEPRKRKRVEHGHGVAGHVHAQAGTSAAGAGPSARLGNVGGKAGMAIGMATGTGAGTDGDGGAASTFEFTTLPSAALYRYLMHHDLVPKIYPDPLSADDPPPPSLLLDAARMASRDPSPALPFSIPTPANRPRRTGRDARDVGKRRRTRQGDEEARGVEQVPVLADVAEVHGVLAAIAQRHFRESAVKEVDTLASFMFVVKARNGGWR